jgi:hypothetical protein
MVECPQWRLRQPHYLNVPGTQWEQTEVSRETGKQHRQSYNVPMLLNPNDAADCDRNGEVIVYHHVDGAKPPRGQAHQFIGDPTPEMEPINDEAEAISATFTEKWSKAFDTFQTSSEGDFTEKLLNSMQRALDTAVKSSGGIPQAAPATQVVSIEEFNALKEQLATMQAALAAKPADARRV